MSRSKKSYPMNLGMPELMSRLGDHSKHFEDNQAPSTSAVVRYMPLIQLLHSELQRRFTRSYSLGVAIISVASFSLSVAAVIFALEANHLNKGWQRSQLGILEDIKQQVIVQADSLRISRERQIDVIGQLVMELKGEGTQGN